MNTEEKKLIPIEELSGLDELLEPNKMQKQNQIKAKTKSLFVLEVPGIDSFLVQNITEMPLFKSSWFSKWFDKGHTFNCHGDLKVVYHSPICPSTIQQMAELLKTNKSFNIVLKQFDPTGTVIAQQTFQKSKLESFSRSNLSYNSSDTEKIYATFTCKKVTIDF